MDVLLLFDVSAKTRPVIRHIGGRAYTTLAGLHKDDRVAVMSTGRVPNHCEPQLVLELTTDFDSAGRSIAEHLKSPGSEAEDKSCQVLAGIDGAAQYFLRQPSRNRRRAIIAITDDQGAGTAPHLTRNAVRDLWKADVVVVGVLVHSGNSVPSIGSKHRGARYAADQTGGDIVNTPDAVEGLQEAIHRLLLRYSLYYALPAEKAGEERSIRVQLTPDASKRYPRATIRARTGYIVPEGH